MWQRERGHPPGYRAAGRPLLHDSGAEAVLGGIGVSWVMLFVLRTAQDECSPSANVTVKCIPASNADHSLHNALRQFCLIASNSCSAKVVAPPLCRARCCLCEGSCLKDWLELVRLCEATWNENDDCIDCFFLVGSV